MPIRIEANFPGGAVENVRFQDGETIHFEAPMGGSPYSMWFYFRISGAKGRTLTLHQQNMEHVLGVLESRTYAKVIPVVKEGLNGEWRRIPQDHIRFSRDPLAFHFSITPDTDETYAAFCYPYQWQDLKRFSDAHAGSYLHHQVIGKSGEGRDFPMLLFDDGSAAEDKRLIVLTGRQHAGETSGSYVLEGAMEALMSDTDVMRKARNRLAVAVFPMVDIDSVEEGRYGKARPPVDFNRDWTADPQRPETRMIYREIEKLSERHAYVFFADIHAPQPGGASFFVPSRLCHMGEKQWTDFWAFHSEFEQSVELISRCRVSDYDEDSLDWGMHEYQFVSCEHQTMKYGIPAAIFEIAYHTDANDKVLTPSDWRDMGCRFMKTLISHYVGNEAGKSGNRAIPVPQKELAWRLNEWDIVSSPQNMAFTESRNRIELQSLDVKNELWVTYKPFLSGRDQKVVFSSGGKAEVEVLVYYYKDGIVSFKYDSAFLLLENGEYEWTLERDDNSGSSHDDFSHFRISIRAKSITDTLSIAIMNDGG